MLAINGKHAYNVVMKKIYIKKTDAIKYFNGVSKLTKLLGINSQAISQWDEYIPEKSAWPLYYLSNAEIPADINFPEEKST